MLARDLRRRGQLPERGFAPGQTAVGYVDNVRRYYEILMWLDSRETLTSQEFKAPQSAEPIG